MVHDREKERAWERERVREWEKEVEKDGARVLKQKLEHGNEGTTTITRKSEETTEMLIHFKSNQLFRFWISMNIINTVMIWKCLVRSENLEIFESIARQQQQRRQRTENTIKNLITRIQNLKLKYLKARHLIGHHVLNYIDTENDDSVPCTHIVILLSILLSILQLVNFPRMSNWAPLATLMQPKRKKKQSI